MKKKILVTGVNGFLGVHVVESLARFDTEIIGTDLHESPNPLIEDKLSRYVSHDLVTSYPEREVPEDLYGIIHLAGQCDVGKSFTHAQEYISTSSAMATDICEYYLKKNMKSPRIVFTTSGAIYDDKEPLPINERSKLNYTSPYVLSKRLTIELARYYGARGIDVVCACPFNLIGPYQREGTLLSNLAKSFVSAKENHTNQIGIGNPNFARDFIDVRDTADAFTALCLTEELHYDLYNICSGRATSVEEIFMMVRDYFEMPEVDYYVDPRFVRENDVEKMMGDFYRLYSETGWLPQYSLKQSIKDTIESIVDVPAKKEKVLLATIHEPEVITTQEMFYARGLTDLFDEVFVTVTDVTDPSYEKVLTDMGYHVKVIEAVGTGFARRTVVSFALETLKRPEEYFYLYSDFDHALSWIREDVNEFYGVLQELSQGTNQITAIGRSKKAWETYPESWYLTEKITNEVASLYFNKPELDITAGQTAFDFECACAIATRSKEESTDSEWLLLGQSLGYDVNCIRVDGRKFSKELNDDRFSDKSWKKWLHRSKICDVLNRTFTEFEKEPW
jgi:GDP-4-dehydro-6-deoxy-D-mannose reductase